MSNIFLSDSGADFVCFPMETVREFVERQQRHILERENLGINRQLALCNAFRLLVNNIQAVTPMMVNESTSRAITDVITQGFTPIKTNGKDILSGECEIGKEFKNLGINVKNFISGSAQLLDNWNYYFNYSSSYETITTEYANGVVRGLGSLTRMNGETLKPEPYLKKGEKLFDALTLKDNAPVELVNDEFGYFCFETAVGLKGRVSYNDLSNFPELYKAAGEKVTKDLSENGLSKSDIVSAFQKLKEELKSWLSVTDAVATELTPYDEYLRWKKSVFTVYIDTVALSAVKFLLSKNSVVSSRFSIAYVVDVDPKTGSTCNGVRISSSLHQPSVVYFDNGQFGFIGSNFSLSSIDPITEEPFSYRNEITKTSVLDFELFFTAIADHVVGLLKNKRESFADIFQQLKEGDNQ